MSIASICHFDWWHKLTQAGFPMPVIDIVLKRITPWDLVPDDDCFNSEAWLRICNTASPSKTLQSEFDISCFLIIAILNWSYNSLCIQKLLSEPIHSGPRTVPNIASLLQHTSKWMKNREWNFCKIYSWGVASHRFSMNHCQVGFSSNPLALTRFTAWSMTQTQIGNSVLEDLEDKFCLQ